MSGGFRSRRPRPRGGGWGYRGGGFRGGYYGRGGFGGYYGRYRPTRRQAGCGIGGCLVAVIVLIVVGCATAFGSFGAFGGDRATASGCANSVDFIDPAENAAVQIERDLSVDGTFHEDDFVEVEEHLYALDELAVEGSGQAASVADERADAADELLMAVEDGDLPWASESLDWLQETYDPLLDACADHL